MSQSLTVVIFENVKYIPLTLVLINSAICLDILQCSHTFTLQRLFSVRSRMSVALNLVPPYLSLLSVSRQHIPWARTEQVCVLWFCFRRRLTEVYQAGRIKHLLSFAIKINKKRNYTKKKKKERKKIH